MVAKASDMRPGLAPVVAREQSGRFDAGVETARARSEAPDRLDGVLAGRIGEALARVGPGGAEIGGFPDRRAKPFVAAAGVDRAVGGVGDDMVDGPSLAEGAAQ